MPAPGTDADWGYVKVEASPSAGGQYALYFYHSEAASSNQANAFRIVDVINPPSTTNQLKIIETQKHNGTSKRYWHYTYSSTANDRTWEMEEGKIVGTTETPLRYEKNVETTVSDPPVVGETFTKTITRQTSSTGTVLSKVVETWEVFAWGNEMVKRVTGTGSNALTEQWDFEDDDTDVGFARVEHYYSGTGYWESYDYTETLNGLDSVEKYRNITVKQLDDNAQTSTDPANAAQQQANIVVEEFRLSPASSVIVASPVTQVTYQRFTTTVANKRASTTYSVRTTDSQAANTDGLVEEWSVVGTVADLSEAAAGTTADQDFVKDIVEGDATNVLSTKTTRYALNAPALVDDDSQPGDIKRIDHLDGQVTLIERNKDTNLDYVVVTLHGYLDESGTAPEVDYGTKTTQTRNVRGSVVESLVQCASESDNSGNLFIKSLSRVASTNGTDAFGRPIKMEYFFGGEAADEWATAGSGTAAYFTEAVHGCCGSGTEREFIDRAGVKSKVWFDALGRMVESTPADSSTSGDIRTEIEYDAADRMTQTTVKANVGAGTLVSKVEYDEANRIKMTEDPEGRRMFYTYRRVKSDGSGVVYTAVDPATDAGEFYWETRVYGHDRALGTDPTPAIRVTWTDSHGRTIRSWTASTTATWSQASPPDGTESLTEESRTAMSYPWIDWTSGANTYTRPQAERWVYHDLPALSSDGAAETNYIVASKVLSDPVGRAFRSTDAAGNITETIYESGTGRPEKTKVGVSTSAAHLVSADLDTASRVFYKKFNVTDNANNPTGNDRPWVTRAYTVEPGLTSTPVENAGMGDYTYTETVETYSTATSSSNDYMASRLLWSRPEHGPWSYSETDEQGRPVASYTTKNDDDDHFLTKSTIAYYADSATPDGDEGKVQYADEFEVDTTTGTVGTKKVRSTFDYDDAGRQAKAETTGRGYRKTAYDEYGRIERRVFASSEGTNTDTYGANAFTDDIVLTEMVPTYDKSGLVTGTVTYERAHDATATGLLSATTADQSRANHAFSWFDANGRQAYTAVTGTKTLVQTQYGDDYDSETEPESSDDILVTQIEYDDAGRPYLRTDPRGREDRTYFDDLGRVTHSVENYDAAKLTGGNPDTPASRDADVNRITKYIYDNSATGGGVRKELVAIDPNADGNTADSQSTLFIHSGEVADANNRRGYIPVNGRRVAVVMPDAVEDGTTRASVITEIDTAGTVFGDFVYTEYFANGQIERTTDQRGVQKNHAYTPEGWLDNTNITESSEADPDDWVSIGDLRVAYTYGDAGETLKVTAYDAATAGNVTSQVQYEYDGFYNVTTEYQAHSGAVNTSTSPKVQYAYDTTVASSVYTKAYRLKTITYPNGRILHNTYDGHSGIDDAISRANAIAEDNAGSPGTDIASYSFLGSGRMVIKDLPTPDIKLDYFGGTSGTYEGLDAFGRIKAQKWVDYSGVSDVDVLHIKHGYDRNSNRLHDDRQVYTGDSKVYGHDGLDRMTSFDQGLIKSDQSAIEDHWITRTQHFGLDQLGNPITVKEYTNDSTEAAFSEITAISKANEIDTIKIMGQRRKPAFVEDEFATDTSSAYEIADDDGDAFSINTTNGELTVTNTGTDGETILLIGDQVALHTAYVDLDFPNENGGEAGYVFGYEDSDNYYLAIVDTQNNRRRFYRVQNGTRSTIKSNNVSSFGTGANLQFAALIGDQIELNGTGHSWLSEGLPAGRVGLYTSQADVKFSYLAVWSDARRPELAGRWRPTGQTTSGSSRNQIRAAEDVLRVSDWVSGHEAAPTVLEGVRAERFEVTYLVEGDQWYHKTYLAFNNQLPNDFDAFRMSIADDPRFWKVYGTKSEVSSTAGAGNPWSSDKKWVRVTSDGTTVEATVIVSSTKPTETDWTNNGSMIRSTDNLDLDGGLFGFGSDSGKIDIHEVTIKTDRDNNGSYETTEYEGDFTLDADGYYEQDLAHDAAGNVTYDGMYAYTYDAFNRLMEVKHAYRAPGTGTLSYGSVVNEMVYDGVDRRIIKYVKNSAYLDCTYHYYYDGHSLIEERDGSDNVIRQNVWGLVYLDELLVTSMNEDPDSTSEQDTEWDRYALHDVQYSVLLLAKDSGGLKDRYEYTAYGQQQSYQSLGDSDTLYLSPFIVPERQWLGGVEQPYGYTAVGFQGLIMDEDTGLVCYRTRYFNQRLKKFNSRDKHPSIYPDGLSANAAFHVLRGGMDPTGMDRIEAVWNDADSTLDIVWIDENKPMFWTAVAPLWGLINACQGDAAPEVIGLVRSDGWIELPNGKVATIESIISESNGATNWDSFQDSKYAIDPKKLTAKDGFKGITGIDEAVAFVNDGDPLDPNSDQLLVTPDRFNDVMTGLDMAEDLVYEAALFYLLGPLELAQSVRTLATLSKVDNICYSKSQTALTTLQKNKIRGNLSEGSVADELAEHGYTIIGSQVYARTSSGGRKIDHLVLTPEGKMKAIEVKNGGAKYAGDQVKKDKLMATEGATLTGKNAPEILRGEKVIIDTEVIRVP